MTGRTLAIIGFGDVVQNRMLAAIRSAELRVACVVDLAWDDRKQESLDRVFPENQPPLFMLSDPSGDSLSALLSSNRISVDAVIIASPTPTHAEFTASLLERGDFVAVEKPLCHDRQSLRQFNDMLQTYGSSSLFAFGYYALEKGLSAFSIGIGNEVPFAYLDQLVPHLQPSEFRDWRKRVGDPVRIRGLLLEGIGSSSQLHHRHWVLEHSNGGNTVETFYHLISVVEPFVDLSRFTIMSTKLMVDVETKREFETATGMQCAETMTAATLKSKTGVTIKLASAKCVLAEHHQRWLEIDFEHGWLRVDFETGTTRMECGNDIIDLSLRSCQKYRTQIELLKSRLNGELKRCETDSFGRALQTTLDIREAGILGGISGYVPTDLDGPAIARLVD